MKERIETLLMSTNRPGMDKLLEYMDEHGFYTAPCSGKHHLCVEGGLAEHTINVYENTMKLYSAMKDTIKQDIGADSLIIVSLLHDLGKIGDYGKPNYVPNILKTGQSKAEPFKTNPDLLYIGHEYRSVKLANKFINLTEDEEFAILYHNGMYGDFRYEINGKETPLYLILHTADMWACRFMEGKDESI